MKSIVIYRGAGEFAEVYPDENSVKTREIMGMHTITLSFSAKTFYDFQFNDRCSVLGKLYKINQAPIISKESGENKYTLTFHAEYFDLSKVLYLGLDSNNTLSVTEHDFNGTGSDFIDLMLRNANDVNGYWQRGDVVDTGYINMSFKDEDCLTVLGRLAEAFGTEWWVEGKTIHLSRRRFATDMHFGVGMMQGLYSITRTPAPDSKIITRIYARGGAKNLPDNYRNFQNRLMMTGGIPYVEENTGLYGIVAKGITFDDIFPHRTGVVSSLGADGYSFFDKDVTFDLNQLGLGIPIKVTFNSGLLSGYTFNVVSFNPTTKEFKIARNTEEKTIEVPSAQLRIQEGDKYVLTDLTMPPPYIVEAEKQLTQAALNYVAKNSRPQYVYNVAISPTYMQGRDYDLDIGYEVQILDADLVITEKITVIKCTQNLKDERIYNVELAQEKAVGKFASLQNTVANTSREVATVARTIEVMNSNIDRLRSQIQ